MQYRVSVESSVPVHDINLISPQGKNNILHKDKQFNSH